MAIDLPLFLTTREMADLLRVKERKVYDLAAAGEIPHSRATGKLLFPREAVLAWISDCSESPASEAVRPPVILGSHDPLLEWALRESGSGLAALFDGSLDGLDRFDAGEGMASGLHIAEENAWNVGLIARRYRYQPVVLVEWAWRRRGIITAPGNPHRLERITDLSGIRLVRRQAKAGSQILLERLVAAENNPVPESAGDGGLARDEREAALAVLDGRADAAFGLEASARQFKLEFVPVCEERFDILVARKDWFEPPFQRLLAFCKTPAFHQMATHLGGYRIEGFGTPRFNGA